MQDALCSRRWRHVLEGAIEGMPKASSAARATDPWAGIVGCGLRLAVFAGVCVAAFCRDGCSCRGRVL